VANGSGAHASAATQAETAPSPLLYNEEDLEAARATAYQDGHAAGAAAAAQANDRAVAEALSALAERMDVLMARWPELVAAGEQKGLDLALAVSAKLFPTLAERESLQEVEKVLDDCLSRMREEPRLVVRAPGALVERLRERLDELTARNAFDGKIVLLEEPSAGASDVLVEWPDGGAERNLERQWHAIEELLSHALHQPKQPDGE
jgi:flagellar assembly protein FliH